MDTNSYNSGDITLADLGLSTEDVLRGDDSDPVVNDETDGESYDDVQETEQTDENSESETSDEPKAVEPAQVYQSVQEQVEVVKGLIGSEEYTKFSQEFEKNGELSEDTYKALVAKGFPKPIVDSFIAGNRALAEQARTQVLQVVGGEQRAQEIVKWAASNLTPQQIKQYQANLDSGDYDRVITTLELLDAKFTAANPSVDSTVKQENKPRRVTQTSKAVTVSVKPFETPSEAARAMNDPRYKTDINYKKTVDKRMNATDFSSYSL